MYYSLVINEMNSVNKTFYKASSHSDLQIKLLTLAFLKQHSTVEFRLKISPPFNDQDEC